MAESRAGGGRSQKTPEAPKLRWDDSNMKSTYANVCNVSSTREEVVLFFGMNQTWQGGQGEVVIQLLNRIILNPFAAQRLHLLLSNVLKEYESRFGPLKMEAGSPPAPPVTP